MYAAEVEKIDQATSAAQAAVDLLLLRNEQNKLHLPVDDLRIALRFLELARRFLSNASSHGSICERPCTDGPPSC